MARLVLFGAPGSGKGTQAALIKKEFSIPHISTGDMFRAAIVADTAMGRRAAEFINVGKLVPDDITLGLVKERLAQPDCQKGFLFDGFPRTLPQAEALKQQLRSDGTPLQKVISLEVPRDELLRRLTGRRFCQQCGYVSHVSSSEFGGNGGTCFHDGSKLIQREDDREEAVSVRLDTFMRQTLPLRAFYEQTDLLLAVDGLGEPGEIFKRIMAGIAAKN